MAIFLLDTMVLSEGFKSRPDLAVKRWLGSLGREAAYLSAITVGEIERGIRKIELSERRPAERYRRWIASTLEIYSDRVLPVSVAIARRWGILSFDLKHTNPDLLIAATALEHDLTIATRNTRHFEPTGAKLFNPYEA